MAHVGILPYALSRRGALDRITVAELLWPQGAPDVEDATPVEDLGDDVHIIVYPNRFAYLGLPKGLRGRVSLLVAEPAAFHRHHLLLARLVAGSLFRILTFDAATLKRAPNAAFVSPGNTWIDLSGGPPAVAKQRNLSLIASSKRRLEGHKLRHATVDELRRRGIDADILGRGYTPIPDKEAGLLPYRFSIVIENGREKDYFTEKLVDAMLCETVPIYWGAPNIVDVFDRRGMIVCNGLDELVNAAARADVALYDEMLPHARENKARALDYVSHEANAVAALLREIDGAPRAAGATSLSAR